MARARDERSGDDGHKDHEDHEDLKDFGDSRDFSDFSDHRDTGASGPGPDDVSEYSHRGASDARLTALLRTDSPTAYTALRELRERHHPSVLAYARLCAASESSARQLATRAFTAATRETARGSEPSVPWRHQLLLLTARMASGWATDDHASGLDPALLVTLRTAGPEGLVPPLLTAFESLPPRAQGLIWYSVVEREPEERTAVLLGLTADDVAYRWQSALHALHQACLSVRLAASEDPRCQDFRRLIEECVRPDSRRHSTDLHSHMAHCAHCTGAYEELCALRDNPRATLAEGLLPWGGMAYAGGGAGARDGSGGRGGSGGRDGGRPEAGAADVAGAEDFSEPGTGTGARAWWGSQSQSQSGVAGAAGAGAAAGAWAGADLGTEDGTGADSGSSAGADSGTGVGPGVVIGAEAWDESRAGTEAWAESRIGPGSGLRDEARVGVAGAAGVRSEEGGAGGVVRTSGGAWSPSRRFVLSSVALSVAVAPLLTFLVFSGSGDSSSPDAASPGGTPTSPPPGPTTPAAPTSPTPSPTASDTERPSRPSKSPEPTKSPGPSPSKPDRRTPSLPYGPPLSGAYAQVVNVGSGLCLDIRGELEEGTDVVTATCSSRATQRWRLDSHLDALQSYADPGLCLDSRGATDEGVSVRECDSLDGKNGENLRFTVDSRGQIRPAIAQGHAVTPDSLGSVAFAEATGRNGQRWRAGAGPVHT
ncbi:ricin-type beta-trefoil lectin domain protein [Streptomyces sp. NPDC012510]|uniref:ricin-type beta-trefoil lectin domain protein n=1 Tax=Streptomyces sp. NPDC012510 TaxID=3364838 RepID=UPI0036E28EA6